MSGARNASAPRNLFVTESELELAHSYDGLRNKTHRIKPRK